MAGKDTTDDILINVRAEDSIDLMRYSRTAESGVTAFQFNDGLDEFGGRALGTGFAFTAGRTQLPAGCDAD